MADSVLEELEHLDRKALMSRMAEELPGIQESLGIGLEDLAEKTGIAPDSLKASQAGERCLVWSEFMSILFVLWRNDVGKGLVESKGLFPNELKTIMSVNRNSHSPWDEEQKKH